MHSRSRLLVAGLLLAAAVSAPPLEAAPPESFPVESATRVDTLMREGNDGVSRTFVFGTAIDPAPLAALDLVSRAIREHPATTLNASVAARREAASSTAVRATAIRRVAVERVLNERWVQRDVPSEHDTLPDFTQLFMFVGIGMTALAANRDTRELANNKLFSYGAATNKKFYKGAQLVLNAAGYAEPAATATGKTAIGRCEDALDTTGIANGEMTVTAKRGVFPCVNAGGITIAHLGKTAWFVDDQTVAEDNGSNTRSVAGIIRQIDAMGVWVETP